jgi:4-amino-4-deoxy-L-arabinose transferase-like glycosyltransferase
MRGTWPGRRGAWELAWPLLSGFAVLLSLGFLGSRGLWEPDEGRYAAVAWEMVASGDYVTPTLNGVPHFTKPPLTYWTVAAGLAALGRNEWGARLFLGLALAATALLVARFGEELWGAARGRWAGVIYLTMGLPFFAGSLITPDTLLTLCETAALFAFWRGWTADSLGLARWWMVGFWTALGVAFMTKGPPALLPLLVVVVFSAVARAPRAPATRAVWLWPGGPAAFLALTLPWFVFAARTYPGLADYLLHDELIGRIATRVHHRNSHWHVGLWIYPATALLGALPWSLTWPAAIARLRRAAGWRRLTIDPARLLLVVWILVPTLLLSLARSRLPLYLLPVFPALALATCTASVRLREPGGALGTRVPRRLALAGVWGVGLLGLRLLAGWQPMPQDTRALAQWIGPHLAPGPTEVIVVDRRIYGLPFYLNAPLELLARRPERIPEYQPTSEPWDEEVGELSQVTYRHVFVVPRRLFSAFSQRVAEEAVPCHAESSHRDLRLLICESPR